jgi:hypothetical protein
MVYVPVAVSCQSRRSWLNVCASTTPPGFLSKMFVSREPLVVTAVITTRWPTVPLNVHCSRKLGPAMLPAAVLPDVMAPPAKAVVVATSRDRTMRTTRRRRMVFPRRFQGAEAKYGAERRETIVSQPV